MANAVLLLLSAVGSAGEMTPLLPTAPKSPAQLALLLQWAALVGFFGDALCGDFFLLYVQGGAIGVSREHYGASQWLCLTALMLSTQMGFFYNYATGLQQRKVGWVVAAVNVAVLLVVVSHSRLFSTRRLRHLLAISSVLVVMSTYAVGNSRWPNLATSHRQEVESIEQRTKCVVVEEPREDESPAVPRGGRRNPAAV